MVTIWFKRVPGGVVVNRFGILPQIPRFGVVDDMLTVIERALEQDGLPDGTKVTLVVPESDDGAYARRSANTLRDAAQGGAGE